jgi:hypothetical protein
MAIKSSQVSISVEARVCQDFKAPEKRIENMAVSRDGKT